jgi:hypothetical protein
MEIAVNARSLRVACRARMVISEARSKTSRPNPISKNVREGFGGRRRYKEPSARLTYQMMREPVIARVHAAIIFAIAVRYKDKDPSFSANQAYAKGDANRCASNVFHGSIDAPFQCRRKPRKFDP